MYKKRLDQKGKVNFKICDVTAWLTNNCNTHNTNISRSKGNKTMKFGKLIECSMRNNFLEIEKLIPSPFLKNQN